MREEIDELLANPYLEAMAYFSVTVLSLIVFLALFELVTKYKNWEQIKAGNLSVAMATGGKIFGICNIFHFAIIRYDTIFHTLVWGCIGYVLLLVAYFIFEFLTPVFKIDDEIMKDNRAVGLMSMLISVSLSFVIGASVSSSL